MLRLFAVLGFTIQLAANVKNWPLRLCVCVSRYKWLKRAANIVELSLATMSNFCIYPSIHQWWVYWRARARTCGEVRVWPPWEAILCHSRSYCIHTEGRFCRLFDFVLYKFLPSPTQTFLWCQCFLFLMPGVEQRQHLIASGLVSSAVMWMRPS